MAGAANVHKSWPGKTTDSWFPYFFSGHILASEGAATVVMRVPVAFDCIIRQAYLTVSLGDTGFPDDIVLQTVDSTVLTIVAAQSPAAVINNVLQTLHADVVNVQIVAGNGFEIEADTAASEGATIGCTLMLEATR